MVGGIVTTSINKGNWRQLFFSAAGADYEISPEDLKKLKDAELVSTAKAADAAGNGNGTADFREWEKYVKNNLKVIGFLEFTNAEAIYKIIDSLKELNTKLAKKDISVEEKTKLLNNRKDLLIKNQNQLDWTALPVLKTIYVTAEKNSLDQNQDYETTNVVVAILKKANESKEVIPTEWLSDFCAEVKIALLRAKTWNAPFIAEPEMNLLAKLGSGSDSELQLVFSLFDDKMNKENVLSESAGDALISWGQKNPAVANKIINKIITKKKTAPGKNMLDYEDDDAKIKLIEVLGRLSKKNDAVVGEILLPYLNTTDNNLGIGLKIAVVNALGEMKYAKAKAKLETLKEDPLLKDKVSAALAKIAGNDMPKGKK